MRYAAIIAEFNPLHDGHRYLIEEVRRAFPSLGILIVMSGNFVQRGDFAVLEKHIRARHALQAGADVVIELPFPFCSSNTRHFAETAVRTLARTGVVDYLVFGSESGDIDELYRMVALTDEDAEMSRLIASYSRELSYPAALERALSERGVDADTIRGIFMPNNVLALGYLRALAAFAPSIRPVTLRRVGAEHDSLTGDCASSMAVRELLFGGRVSKNVPYYVAQDLEEALSQYDYKGAEARLLHFLQGITLNRGVAADDVYDCDMMLARRLSENLLGAGDYDALLAAVKTKRYTMARIKRILLYLLTSTDRSTYVGLLDAPPVVNVLAVRNGRYLSDFPCAISNAASDAGGSPLLDAIRRADRAYSALFATRFSDSCVFLEKNV